MVVVLIGCALALLVRFLLQELLDAVQRDRFDDPGATDDHDAGRVGVQFAPGLHEVTHERDRLLLVLAREPASIELLAGVPCGEALAVRGEEHEPFLFSGEQCYECFHGFLLKRICQMPIWRGLAVI